MNSSERRKRIRSNRRTTVSQRDSGSSPPPTAPITRAKPTHAQTKPPLPYSENDRGRDIPVLSIRQGAAKHLPYYGVILLLPMLVLSGQINAIYTPPGSIDSWVYLGFFRNFANFEGALFPNTYYGSRLSWILPGVLIHHFFSPATAACVLHLLVYFVALFSFYYIVAATIGRRAAALSSIVFGLYPYFWAAIGWDYADGVGIAYYLLTTALLTKAAFASRPRLILGAAGCAFAGLLYSNVAWTLFTPILAMHYLGLRRPAGMREWRDLIIQAAICGMVGGFCITLILGVINHSVTGSYWFYRPSVQYALKTLGQKNPWYTEAYAGGLPVPWLWFPIFMVMLSIPAWLRLFVERCAPRNRITALFTLELLIAFATWVYQQTHGTPLLGLPFYASYLIPLVFLAAAPLFWPAAEELGPGWFAIALMTAVLVVAAPWWMPRSSHVIRWSRPENHVFVLTAAIALVSAMLFRRSGYAIALSIVGFGLLNTTVSPGRPVDPYSGKNTYQRVMNTRAVVEQVRGSEPIRWWYNKKESQAEDFTAISSTYLWGFTLIGLEFPHLAQRPVFPVPCLLAVISSQPDTPEAAGLALAQPLKEQGLTATLKRVLLINDHSVRYTLALMQIERVRPF